MVIRFLIADAYPVGGTVRTTFMTAGELARRGHEVEVVSVYRRADEPQLPLDPQVRLRDLADLRGVPAGALRGRAAARPSRLFHPEDNRHPRFNLLTDAALLRFLKTVRDGALVGTRPGLNVAIARHARRRAVRVGQDHMNLDGYPPGLVEAIRRSYGRLDAVTTLTEDTATRYRELLGPDARVETIPNAAPRGTGRRAALDERVVMAAGTLSARKGFDRLLRAWAQVAPRHPGWRLEVFGSGEGREALERRIADLGLGGSARLCGHSPRLPEELARASIFAMTSRREGFPMVLLEAMSAGVPVVAYDCPTGPRDVVTDGVDGYVVPDGRTRLLAEALDRLMGDEERRRRFGAAAVEKAAGYRIDAIAERWEALFEELASAKRGGPTAPGRGAPRAPTRA